MSKFKSFTQFLTEKENTKEYTNNINEATITVNVVDPESKDLQELLQNNDVNLEVIDEDKSTSLKQVKLTGKKEDLTTVLSDSKHGWDDSDLADEITEAQVQEIKTAKEAKKQTNFYNSLKVGDKVIYNTKEKNGFKKGDEVEVDSIKSGSTFDSVITVKKGNKKAIVKPHSGLKPINEAEDKKDQTIAEKKACADMLNEIYEGACKNEAKAYEEDAHDEHTVESYMKENAALVGGLSAKCLKEMKEEYTMEAYEAACNEMIEAYSKKVNETKETDNAADATDIN